jgi:hypothetical protein
MTTCGSMLRIASPASPTGQPVHLTVATAHEGGDLTIRFSAPETGHASLAIYAVDGSLVARLFDGSTGFEGQTVVWNTLGLAMGVYFCQLDMNGARTSVPVMVGN